MDEFLYLEADEEITSVIDKLKGLETDSVGLVVPKGSMIAQSLVSLKLLQKEAKKLSKKLAIVTSDEVGRNLATQVGLDVYADVKSRTPLVIKREGDESRDQIEIDMTQVQTDQNKDQDKKSEVSAEEADDLDKAKLPKDFTIHRYDEAKENDTTESEPVDSDVPELDSSSDVNDAKGEYADNEKAFIKRPVGELKDYAQRQEMESAGPTKYQDYKSSAKRVKRKVGPIVYIISAVIAFATLFALTDLLVAKLNIKIAIEADEIEKDTEMIVERDRKEVSIDEGIIPGVYVSKEKDVEKSITATGEKNMGEKAKGIVVFKNESGIDEEVAAGSSLKSSSSVEFTLDSTVVVPKATLNSAGDKVLGQANGAITAKEAGTQGNMGATTSYAIVGKSKITVSGSTSGGITKKVKVVTRSDIERGKQELQDEYSDDLQEEAKSENTGKIFLDEAGEGELSDYKTDKNVDDEADSFVAKGKLRYVTIVFSLDDLEEVAVAQLEKNLEEGKGLVRTDSDQITPKIQENQSNVGKLKISVNVKSHVGPKIDMEQQRSSLRARPLKSVKETLGRLEGVEVGTVDLSPSWVLPIAPILTGNIKIDVEYSSKNDSGT